MCFICVLCGTGTVQLVSSCNPRKSNYQEAGSRRALRAWRCSSNRCALYVV
ncbi:hypothetical protein PF003_g6681 [Phytophthora fragariae]|nr:hypothetical protein PF003_g6682 [Phytophthora fragariae]KAE8908693.1 hypothetical protein PF003_g6681 [Phytophthora fragariae]